MDVAADLAEHLESQYEVPDDDEGRAGFRFDTDSKANWGMTMLARYHQEAVEVSRLATEQRAVIDEWEEARRDAIGVHERFFQGGLADYWRRELQPELARHMAHGLSFEEAWAKVTTKSRKLPAGTLKATRAKTSVVVDDPAGFIEWARNNGRTDLLNYPDPVPAKTAIAALPQRDGAIVFAGQVLPGVHINDPGVRYSASPNLDVIPGAV